MSGHWPFRGRFERSEMDTPPETENRQAKVWPRMYLFMLHSFFDLDDFVGNQTMTLAMHFHRCLPVRSADKTEYLS